MRIFTFFTVDRAVFIEVQLDANPENRCGGWGDAGGGGGGGSVPFFSGMYRWIGCGFQSSMS